MRPTRWRRDVHPRRLLPRHRLTRVRVRARVRLILALTLTTWPTVNLGDTVTIARQARHFRYRYKCT